MKDSSTLQDVAFFHTLAHILGGGETDQMFTKILPENRCIFEQGSPH